jgi:PAS domain S-box-containing protein
MANQPVQAPGTWVRRLLAALPGRPSAPGDPHRVLLRKVEILHARLPVGVAVAALVPVFVVALVPAPAGRGGLLAWGAASVAVAALRLVDCLLFRRRPRDPAAVRRSHAFVIAGAVAQGLLWAILGGFLFPAEPLAQFFLLLVLTGMAGGSMAFLPLLNTAYSLFIFLLMVPASVQMMAAPLPIQKGVGVLGLVYTLALLMASAKTSRWFRDALDSALEREDLVARLQASRDRLEEQKAHLERVVAERTVSLSEAVTRLRDGLREKEQERQRAARSDARHLSLLQALNEGFGHVDGQEQFLFANPAAETMLGVAPGTLVGRNLLEFLEPEAAARVRTETGLRRQGLDSRYQLPVIRADGQRRLLQVASSPLFDEDGRFIGSSAVFDDVTERIQAEDGLRAALAFNAQIIASAHQGIIVYDTQGRFRLWNPFMEALTGLSAEAVLGRGLSEVLPLPVRAAILEAVDKALQGQSVTLPPFPWAIPATGRSGWASSILAPMLDSDGAVTGAVETVADLTEWKRVEQRQRDLEAELHHSQKLESIGSLAGGIAHDMNNVLAAVQAVVQTLRDRHPGEAGLQSDLGLIERAANRGRDLVKGLTNFVRKELEKPEPLDLNALVREVVALLGHTTLQRITLVVDLDETLPAVMGERGALGGALMNLCVNALDAMPEQGTLALRTRGGEDGLVQLLVEDTGRGMPPEILARATEPFFTTKETGKGTGLGLALVYATIKAHGGTLALRSTVGRGSVVEVRLPAADGAPAPGLPAAGPPPAPGALRILQVDDDDLILASVPRMLEQAGHRVETAAGGREALERLQAGLDVDVVILDLNMPGMNGLEALDRIRALRPDLPVLLATGFLEPGAEQRLRASGRAMGISKPFSMSELGTALRKVTLPGAGASG